MTAASTTLLRYSANMSMFFADLPLLDRPRAAAAAGFTFVESWWPFAEPEPAPGEAEAFAAALAAAGVALVAINLDAGDPAQGERGMLCDPARADRFGRNLAAVVRLLDVTGCRVVNALYGNRPAGVAPAEADRVALERLVVVADAVGPRGSVVIETLNTLDSPGYPLTDIGASARLVAQVNDRARQRNTGLLVDVYHLATMGTRPAAALRAHAPLVRHVQFADAPGRGRPGTGRLDFAELAGTLRDISYAGYVGLEYVPNGGGVAPLPADLSKGVLA
jgi:hydroxypyruvate isomerase